jgi:hypothetical protein
MVFIPSRQDVELVIGRMLRTFAGKSGVGALGRPLRSVMGADRQASAAERPEFGYVRDRSYPISLVPDERHAVVDNQSGLHRALSRPASLR